MQARPRLNENAVKQMSVLHYMEFALRAILRLNLKTAARSYSPARKETANAPTHIKDVVFSDRVRCSLKRQQGNHASPTRLQAVLAGHSL